MQTTSDTIDLTRLDVRPVPCRQKHALIFQRWHELPVGEHFILVNDHDPVPLYYQFAGQFPGAFNWEYLMEGPEEFHVRITRLAPSLPLGSGPVAPRPASGGCGTGELDVRGLEAPEPMLRILAAVETLPAGRVLVARTERKPVHLLAELPARGVGHSCEELPDGSWRVRLIRS